MRQHIQVFCLFIFALGVVVYPIQAQSQDELSLNLRRNFGFSTGTGKIQGTFTLSVSGPDNLNRVIFLIDDEVLGEVNQPPYKVQFDTDEYPLGVHTLSAAGFTTDGRELRSNEIRTEFISSEEGWKTVLKILGPILAVVFGGMLLSYAIAFFTGRGLKRKTPQGAPRDYGAWGGAICPKCARPFARHIWGLNLIAGKYDRCPHCGRWSLVQRASPQELSAAEAAELLHLETGDKIPSLSEDNRLHKDLEDSRYQDL